MKEKNKKFLVISLFAAVGVLAFRSAKSKGWNDPWNLAIAGPVEGGGDWPPGYEPNLVEEIAEALGMLKISEMKNVNRTLLGNPNVQAFLRVIRSKESSQSPDAYRMIVGPGRQMFDDFSDHPRIKGLCWTTSEGKRLCSTAAGAYQITATTFDEAKRVMGIRDFSPASQDLIALGRIAARGALNDVLSGNVEAAVRKLPLEWEAFKRWPDPVYYKNVFVQYGGQLTTTRMA